MKTILDILQRAGGWHHGLHLHIENPPYMALVIEATDESGPCGLPALSVCHYGEQNGDAMRDPEMCFELGFAGGAHLNPFYWRNDYVGVEQWSRFIRDAHYCYHTQLHAEHERFAKLWDKTCNSRASPKPSSGSDSRAPNPSFPANGAETGQRVRFTTTTANHDSRSHAMQDSSAFQYLAIDTIHESTTNPRRTFDEAKLYELAESIKANGLIQPITVRPNKEGFEVVTGARRYRASLLADLFTVPARIVDINDAQAIEWQLVENSQRVDVHPYEEAQGFQRLLDLPGYDVAALVKKSGKSASHIYARLSLLQLIPSVAEAFVADLITASHATLIARLPQEHQPAAFENCWRKDWQDKEAHLLPAKHLSAWIQTNLYLNLAEAPFDRQDPTLKPEAGACATCPRRSGYNTSLFCDVQGDQCLDAPCYHAKVEAHLDREIAAHPGLVLIENGWRNPKEQRPGAVQLGHVRQIETVIDNNPDAEPDMPCNAAKSAIIVYGRNVGAALTVCTDRNCPVHDPAAAARIAKEQADNPAPVMEPAQPDETEEEAAEREREYAQQRQEYEEEQRRREEERKLQNQREHEAHEAERARLLELHKTRLATLDRIAANAPAMFTPVQLRTFLSALIHLDPYMFEDIAEQQVADEENNQQSAEEILTVLLANMPDDKLTSYALRLVLTSHASIPRQGEFDYLADAEAAFIPPPPKKASKPKKTKAVTPIEEAKKTVARSTPAKKSEGRKKAA